MNTQGYQAYRRTQIQTSDQGNLILICYDGAIGFLLQALKAQKEHDVITASGLLTRAQNVLWELTNSLNHDAGKIASNLDALYNYMIRRLVDAQYHNTQGPINEVVGYLQELRESWRQVIQRQS
jgi:flagellar protein FliS